MFERPLVRLATDVEPFLSKFYLLLSFAQSRATRLRFFALGFFLHFTIIPSQLWLPNSTGRFRELVAALFAAVERYDARHFTEPHVFRKPHASDSSGANFARSCFAGAAL